MLRYGSDKPDLRYGLEIVDLSDLAAQTEFKVFRTRSRPAARCAASTPRGRRRSSRARDLDELTEFVERYGAKGLAWIKVEADKFTVADREVPAAAGAAGAARSGSAPSRATCCCSSPTRRTSSARRSATCARTWRRSSSWSTRRSRTSRSPGSSISRRSSGTRRRSAGRRTIIRSRRRADEDLAEAGERPGPACGPRPTTWSSTATSAAAAASVSTTRRCSRGCSRVLGMTPEQARQRFGFLLDALKFGAPPHGGIALGLDRLAMMLSQSKP